MVYIALLRGINVGGNNIIKKEALAAVFTSVGCAEVTTYIQSGNVLFRKTRTGVKALTTQLEAALKKEMDNDIPVVVYTKSQYLEMLAKAPRDWGEDEDQKHNALFLLDDTSAAEAKKLFPELSQDHETLTSVDGVLFWSGSRAYYARTGYAKGMLKSPLYKRVTIRNARTSKKLAELLEAYT